MTPAIGANRAVVSLTTSPTWRSEESNRAHIADGQHETGFRLTLVLSKKCRIHPLQDLRAGQLDIFFTGTELECMIWAHPVRTKIRYGSEIQLMKVLLIEDHQQIANIIFEYFEIKGFTLDWTPDGWQGLELAQSGHYDVIVLDITLPHMDGLTLCRKLREGGNDTPVLMLTARDQKEDILAGYEHGTDGYLVKPFDLKVLEARILALHRRHMGSMAARSLRFGSMELDLTTHTLSREGQQFKLNKKLYTIMKLLMLRAPGITTREEIIDEVWADSEPDHDVLRSHIYLLRAQVDKQFDYSYIRTIPKVGYQLVEKSGK